MRMCASFFHFWKEKPSIHSTIMLFKPPISVSNHLFVGQIGLKPCLFHTEPLCVIKKTTIRSSMRVIHVFVGIPHIFEMSQAEPAVVNSAAGALDVEAAIDPYAGCVAARTELSADALEILHQSFVLWIAATLAFLACFSEVVLRFAGRAVDGEAFWADCLVYAFDDSKVLVAVLPS